MDQPQTAVQEQAISAPAGPADTMPVAPPSATSAGSTISPQACSSCGAMPAANNASPTLPLPPPCIYVIGHIEPRFPQLSLEKEARQVISRGGPTWMAMTVFLGLPLSSTAGRSVRNSQ